MLRNDSNVTAIINGYKRAANVDNIILSLFSQTYPLKSIYVWWNDPLEASKSLFRSSRHVHHVISSSNLGVWARFTFALNVDTEFAVIFDDDTIPGLQWVENCIEHSYLGLLGTVGLIYHDRLRYMNHTRFGWPNPNDAPVQVDIVGHCWFFRREWLSSYFRDLPPTSGFSFFGEDIHFSYTLQKYLGIDTYVPPHPVNSYQMWGSLNGLLGTDSHALSMTPDAASKWDIPFHYYLEQGFQLIIDASH